MRRAFLIAISLVALYSTAALAQPNCKKGKPCGNTCIAQNRTCRVGSTASDGSSGSPSPSRPSASSFYAPSATDLKQRSERADTLMPWVAAMSPSVYYASACTGAATIAADRRLYFRTEENLQRIGYRRAEAKAEGCTLEQLQEHERRVAASTAGK